MATDLPDFYTNGTYVIEGRPFGSYQSAATYLISVMGFESGEAYSYCKRMREKNRRARSMENRACERRSSD